MEHLNPPLENFPLLWKKDPFFQCSSEDLVQEKPIRNFYQKSGTTKIHHLASLQSNDFLVQMKLDWEDFQKNLGTGEFLILSQSYQKLFLIKIGKIERCFVSKLSNSNHISFMMKYSY
jgi:hypothetical protein